MNCASTSKAPGLSIHSWIAQFVLAVLFLSGCSANQTKLQPEEISTDSRPVRQIETIALLGGTGMAGGYILREALVQGYAVRVLTRSADKLAYLGNRVTVIEGDARDPRTIDTLLSGSDVVISAIGPRRNSQDARDKLTSTVSGHIADAMPEHDIDRYIIVTGAAVNLPGDRRNFQGWLMRQLARLRYPALVADRQQEYQVLRDSGVDWTLVRCPIIDSAGFEQPAEISFVKPSSFTLRAGELAQFIVELIGSDRYLQQGPALNSLH
jgi:putative NADH-flavin reductase